MLRVVRINHYGPARTSGDGAGFTLDVVEPESRSMRELMDVGAQYFINLIPPTGWDVLRITGADLAEAVDDQGNRLAPWPSPPADVAPGDGSGSAIEVMLRTAPPASTAQRLAKFSARVGLLLGKAQPVRVLDVKRQVGRSLLDKVAPDDIVFSITALDDTSVSLNASGRTDRIGAIRFEDASGDPVEPYGRQIESGNKDANSQPTQDWRFQFEHVPPDLNMRVNIYLDIQAQTVTLELAAVPLP